MAAAWVHNFDDVNSRIVQCNILRSFLPVLSLTGFIFERAGWGSAFFKQQTDGHHMAGIGAPHPQTSNAAAAMAS